MFGSLVAKLNSWTINMGIYVMYLLKGQADVQSNLEGTLQTRRTFEWSGAEVGWTHGKGFGWSFGTISNTGPTHPILPTSQPTRWARSLCWFRVEFRRRDHVGGVSMSDPQIIPKGSTKVDIFGPSRSHIFTFELRV